MDEAVAALPRRNRRRLREAGVAAVHLCGAAGAGKTSLIEATLHRMSEPKRIAVIVAHPDAERDGQRLIELAGWTLCFETAGLTPEQFREALDQIDLGRCDLILIESPGTSAASVGETASLAVFAVPENDEELVEWTSLGLHSRVVLTKTDLLPWVSFCRERFDSDLRRVNPQAQLFELSAQSGEGMDRWIDWLEMRSLEARFQRSPGGSEQIPAEWWFG